MCVYVYVCGTSVWANLLTGSFFFLRLCFSFKSHNIILPGKQWVIDFSSFSIFSFIFSYSFPICSLVFFFFHRVLAFDIRTMCWTGRIREAKRREREWVSEKDKRKEHIGWSERIRSLLFTRSVFIFHLNLWKIHDVQTIEAEQKNNQENIGRVTTSEA